MACSLCLILAAFSVHFHQNGSFSGLRSEQIRKNCAITLSLCAGRSPGQSLPRPAKSEGAWRQTAHHSAPRGPSFVTIGESWVWDSIRGG